MQFTTETIINAPIEKVIALFDDPQNLPKWMEGLQSFEHISGTPGQPGAKSRLKFKIGKREFDLIETVTVRDLPHEFSGTYDAQGVQNIVRNRFIKLAGDKTKYVTENEFQFKGFMKILALLMPGAFKKQSIKYAEDFKRFVEGS